MPRPKRRDLNFNRQVGKRIKHAREAAGLIQQGLAAAVGVGVSTVGNWEIGHALPSIRPLRIIAEITGRSPGYFVGMELRPELRDDQRDALAVNELMDEETRAIWLRVGQHLAQASQRSSECRYG